MKNSWLIWACVFGVVISVLFAFNYQGEKEVIPLSEIFPDEKTYPVDIEYEFIDEVPTEKILQEKTSVGKVPSADKPKIQTVQTKDGVGGYLFSIQIASFKAEERAKQSLNKAIQKGFDGYIATRDLGEKGLWHRVYVGRFQSKVQANDVLIEIKKSYPSSFIISTK